MKNKENQTKRLYNKKVVEKLHCNMTSGHKSNKIFVINDWSWRASIFIKENKGLKKLVKSTTFINTKPSVLGFSDQYIMLRLSYCFWHEKNESHEYEVCGVEILYSLFSHTTSCWMETRFLDSALQLFFSKYNVCSGTACEQKIQPKTVKKTMLVDHHFSWTPWWTM